MKKFNIKVNGKSYEVEVEEVNTSVVSAPAVQNNPQPPVAAAPQPSKPLTSAPPTGSASITAPMPGNIISVKVKVGDVVKAGDVLCILEAMKMENEIMAPKAGTVASVHVEAGNAVNNGDVLVSIG